LESDVDFSKDNLTIINTSEDINTHTGIIYKELIKQSKQLKKLNKNIKKLSNQTDINRISIKDINWIIAIAAAFLFVLLIAKVV
jgi:hypothetical protein